MKLENIFQAFVLFGGLVGLLVIITNGLASTYEVEEPEQLGVMAELDGLLLVQSMNETVSFVYTISDPTSGVNDILGSLMASGIGAIKSMLGVVTFLPEILFVVVKYYPVPGILISMAVVLFMISVGFILLNNYTRGGN